MQVVPARSNPFDKIVLEGSGCGIVTWCEPKKAKGALCPLRALTSFEIIFERLDRNWTMLC